MASYAEYASSILGEPVSASGSDVLQSDISEFMVEGAQFVVNAMPKEMLWAMESNQDFVDGSNAAEGVAVGSNKILQVVRESDSLLLDTNNNGQLNAYSSVECREIPTALAGRAAVGSGWQEEASETDPVYYKIGGKVHILPTSTKTNSKVYWVQVPPSAWESNAHAQVYMNGTILKEIEPLIMLYVLKKAFAVKLAKIQFGTSVAQGGTLEAYIADEDLDMAQAQQLLISDLQAMVKNLENEFQLGIQLLMEGTYKPELIAKAQTQDTYAKLQGRGA